MIGRRWPRGRIRVSLRPCGDKVPSLVRALPTLQHSQAARQAGGPAAAGPLTAVLLVGALRAAGRVLAAAGDEADAVALVLERGAEVLPAAVLALGLAGRQRRRENRLAFLSSVVTDSNNWNRACSGSVGWGPGGLGVGCAARSSGSSCATSCATCGVASALRMAARCSASVPVRQPRMTWIHGQYAGAPPPSQHRPHATRTPCASAKRPNSSASPWSCRFPARR